MQNSRIISNENQTNKFGSIAEWMVHRIKRGELTAGDFVPSSRQLAAELGVARGTVIRSYNKLIEQGYFEIVRGQGTRVSRHLISCGESNAATEQHCFQPPSLAMIDANATRDSDFARQREFDVFTAPDESFIKRWTSRLFRTLAASAS